MREGERMSKAPHQDVRPGGFQMRITRIFRNRLVRFGAVFAVIAGLVALALTWRPAIAPIPTPSPSSFAPEMVARGAVLAQLGDCAVCHTAEDGRPLAGGLPLATPFGVLYTDNLTPDRATGIGDWSPQAFRRAMKDGVDRSGAHLYPGLPYDHFTHVTDADLDAIYAFLMTRRPVTAKAPANRLIPPLGSRPLLAGWKLLFLHTGPTPVDAGRSAEWNRGAYLVAGLGHCGACHTPRNLAGGEERSHAYAGGLAEGWRAPALNASNPAARAWTADALYDYLRTGLSPDHSAAGGPMGPVIEGLSSAPDTDVRAIAVYIASQMGGKASIAPAFTPIDAAAAAGRLQRDGATLFAGACAGCHGVGAPMLGQGRPSLSLASDVWDDDPTSAIQAVLRGVEPSVAQRGPKMPGFADSLTDTQVADVLAYVRTRYSDRPDWPHLEKAVRAARKGSTPP
jgi:mono/diheme cytochrome c family protein